jgi:hypothetical protein
MKLDVDANEVILSNVGTTGEFRIKNSQKAFAILSSGLYSNKIRAIIRELSCNAVDSHVAAGKADIPFEVHLPTIFEPWFAVKDFGIGLTGDQVTSIYTTYFESTKTDSNEFIGALGLGSKSPFSYTENFTVTAIKDGTKRIYSAFINEMGVPGIVEMSCDATDEGNGVEVKFSVTDRYDYNSFRHEAQEVFCWFKLVPKITGTDEFQIQPEIFREQNIVPGVHYRNSHGSIAIMGNIAYSLNKISEPRKYFGDLAYLLECNLAIEFNIGELDFAASREELSYVPLTISSIKKKLEFLNSNLVVHLAEKANAIDNLWLRAVYLYTKLSENLFRSAVIKYVADTKFPLFDDKNCYGKKSFKYSINDLLAKKGFTINAFGLSNGKVYNTGINSDYINGNYVKILNIPVDSNVVFVFNDLKTGCQSRSRYHYANHHNGPATVYCVDHNGSTPEEKEAAFNAFMVELYNPPNIVKASSLQKQVRAKPVSTSGITRMELKALCRSGYEGSYTFRPITDEIDDNQTYYYVLLNGYRPIKEDGTTFNVYKLKELMDNCGIKNITNINVYGVRKSRAKEIQELDNWIPLEDKIREETAKVADKQIISLVATDMLDNYSTRVYTKANVAKMVGPTSDYAVYMAKYGSIPRSSGNVSQLVELCGTYGKTVQVDRVKKEIIDTKNDLYKKYPLLKYLHIVPENEVADYIKLIDKQ